MALKLYIQLLFVITTVLQGYQFLPLAPQCPTEEIAAIIDENTDSVNEAVQNSSNSVQELLTAISKITQSPEYLQLLQEFEAINETLNNLKQGICTTEGQIQYDLKISRINTGLLKCSASANKKEVSIRSKVESLALKSQTAKAKALLLLDRCGSSKFNVDCTLVSACCERVVTQLTTKIGTTKIGSVITEAVTATNNCVIKVAKDALKLEASIKEVLLDCRLQGDESNSVESNESGESPTNTTEHHPSEGGSEVNDPSQAENQEPLQNPETNGQEQPNDAPVPSENNPTEQPKENDEQGTNNENNEVVPPNENGEQNQEENNNEDENNAPSAGEPNTPENNDQGENGAPEHNENSVPETAEEQQQEGEQPTETQNNNEGENAPSQTEKPAGDAEEQEQQQDENAPVTTDQPNNAEEPQEGEAAREQSSNPENGEQQQNGDQNSEVAQTEQSAVEPQNDEQLTQQQAQQDSVVDCTEEIPE